jgi:hypothetical protein
MYLQDDLGARGLGRAKYVQAEYSSLAGREKSGTRLTQKRSDDAAEELNSASLSHLSGQSSHHLFHRLSLIGLNEVES